MGICVLNKQGCWNKRWWLKYTEGGVVFDTTSENVTEEEESDREIIFTEKRKRRVLVLDSNESDVI